MDDIRKERAKRVQESGGYKQQPAKEEDSEPGFLDRLKKKGKELWDGIKEDVPQQPAKRTPGVLDREDKKKDLEKISRPFRGGKS